MKKSTLVFGTVYAVALTVGLIALIGCQKTPTPDWSPISPPTIDINPLSYITLPQPNDPPGYLMVSWPDYWPQITGTFHITHELRTLDDTVLAFRVDRQPITLTNLLPITQTIGPNLYYDFAWPMTLDESAIDWVKAVLILNEPDQVTLRAPYFSDVETYSAADDRGFSPLRLIQIHRQFLPLIIHQNLQTD